MAEKSVTLHNGLRIGDDRLKEAVVREATAGDVIEAQAEAERLVYAVGPEGQKEPTLVMSPSMIGIHVLRRQIARLEGGGAKPYQGPLSLADMKKLTPADLNLLQLTADELDEAAGGESMDPREAERRGRDDPDGGADG